MSAKGQASLEALMWLSLAVIMALAAAVAFADGLASAEEAKSNMELTGVLTAYRKELAAQPPALPKAVEPPR